MASGGKKWCPDSLAWFFRACLTLLKSGVSASMALLLRAYLGICKPVMEEGAQLRWMPAIEDETQILQHGSQGMIAPREASHGRGAQLPWHDSSVE